MNGKTPRLLAAIFLVTLVAAACGQTEGGEREVIDDVLEPESVYSISGRVWLDANGDGLQDTGEAGLSGAPVNLLAEGLLIDSTITGENGEYKFEEQLSRDYVVEFEAPPGFSFSPQDQADEKLNSDANPDTGRTDTIIAGSRSIISNVDAGVIPPGPGSGGAPSPSWRR